MRITELSRSYGAASAKVLEANPMRLWFGVCNKATLDLYLSFQEIAANTGIIAIEPGGFFATSLIHPWSGEVWIRPLASGIILIQEVSL